MLYLFIIVMCQRSRTNIISHWIIILIHRGSIPQIKMCLLLCDSKVGKWFGTYYRQFIKSILLFSRPKLSVNCFWENIEFNLYRSIISICFLLFFYRSTVCLTPKSCSKWKWAFRAFLSQFSSNFYQICHRSYLIIWQHLWSISSEYFNS